MYVNKNMNVLRRFHSRKQETEGCNREPYRCTWLKNRFDIRVSVHQLYDFFIYNQQDATIFTIYL